MDSPRHRKELQQRTSAEWARTSALATELAGVGGGEVAATPRPGEVYLLPEGLDEAIEWVILEEDGGRLFLVPADATPMVGSADVEVPPSRPCGPLVLRCGSGVWIEVRPDPADRTGILSPADLDRARRHCRAIEAGEVGTVLAREVDEEHDYRRHLETLERVRSAVEEGRSSRAAAESAQADEAIRQPAQPSPFADGPAPTAARSDSEPLATAPTPVPATSVADIHSSSSRKRPFAPGGIWAVAASLLLVSTLMLWGRNTHLAERLAELESNPAGTDLGALAEPNIPVAWLLGDLRSASDPEILDLHAESRSVVLVLRAPGAEDVPDGKATDPKDGLYRLELRRQGDREVLWQHDGLRESGEGEITLAMPRQDLGPGVYELELWPRDGSETSRIYTFQVRVRDLSEE